MTDIETDDILEWAEKELSGYAKLRQSLRSKYEWQINEMQGKYEQTISELKQRIDDLEGARASDNKKSFKSLMEWQGIKWDFDKFYEKYGDKMNLEELSALYKGLHWWSEQPSQQIAESPKESPSIWPKSVIAGANPTMTGWKSIEDMSVDEMIKFWKSMGISLN